MTNHAAQLAIIKHVTRQESRSSAGNCQADEPAGITQLSWQLSFVIEAAIKWDSYIMHNLCDEWINIA